MLHKMTGGVPSYNKDTPSVFAFGESSALRSTPVAALTVHWTVIHYRDCALLTLITKEARAWYIFWYTKR